MIRYMIYCIYNNMSYHRGIADLLFIFKQLHGVSNVNYNDEITFAVYNNDCITLRGSHVCTVSYYPIYVL